MKKSAKQAHVYQRGPFITTLAPNKSSSSPDIQLPHLSLAQSLWKKTGFALMFFQLSPSCSIGFSHSARASDLFVFPCILAQSVCAAIIRIQLGFRKNTVSDMLQKNGVSRSLLSRARDTNPFILSIVIVRVSGPIQTPSSPLGLRGHFPGCLESSRQV